MDVPFQAGSVVATRKLMDVKSTSVISKDGQTKKLGETVNKITPTYYYYIF